MKYIYKLLLVKERSTMKINKEQLNNAITVNVNDEMAQQIRAIAEYCNRKPAELLRLLLTPVIINEYTKIMLLKHDENRQPMTQAIFKQ